MDKTTNRREFSQAMLGSLLTYSLIETLFARDAFAKEIQPVTAKWLMELNDLGKSVKGSQIKQTVWQDKIHELFAKTDLTDLLKFIDFDKLTHNIQFKERGERAIRPQFPSVEGLPRQLVFGHQVFALQKDRSVVPHGHNNMATAFLILKGNFHGRHYDRLDDTKEHMIVRPTIDKRFKAGEYSTVSDHKDNVHWFQATSETAFIFNIHVLHVDPKIKKSGRVYIDPHGEKLSGGRVKARKLRAAEAFQQFG